jgi:GNAT superfamily N-acetyltransferase
VAASPFTGLLVPEGPAYTQYAVAEKPGRRVYELGNSLEILRATFAPDPVRFELIDEACPGAVDVLLAAGIEETGRYPLLTLDTAELALPAVPAGVTVHVSKSNQDAVDAQRVADTAFGSKTGSEPDAPGDPAGGGSVLARIGDEAVATAFWTAVADGVATMPRYRNRGLGALVTAAAVSAVRELAGVELAWLTPGHDGADRIYRRAGFTPAATAVHLVAN